MLKRKIYNTTNRIQLVSSLYCSDKDIHPNTKNVHIRCIYLEIE